MSSSRSRAVPRRATSFTDNRSPTDQVMRWDGAVRTCLEWNNLHKDSELWFRNGNCLIHLYGKGQSQRGPSFRVPLSGLIGAGCFPLIERFLATDEPTPQGADEIRAWHRSNPRRTAELYIPPPTTADKSQAFYYHLATRNFLAWVFRRSMVGEQLGAALVGLLHSMHEFRSEDEDNVEDLMDYLDEEGYLDLVGQADYALAMLHLAECFQMKGLYVQAFAHCVGMSDVLHTSTEFEHTSLTSKKLIRKGRRDLDAKLFRATDLLKDFLDEELSEAYLGIPGETRLHLERFRSFLLSFYTTQMGYYPPRAFEADVLMSMRRDFEALYELLVDTAYVASEIMPSVMVGGGICTLQLVQSFDARNRYEPLAHPLPLLPQFLAQPRPSPASSTGRLLSSWLPRPSERIKPDQRFVAHASLIKASNWREHIFKNDLVRAYRSFEESSVVAPNKADRQEKVSLMDARKVRWILVYAVYKVLRSVTDVAPEVSGDVEMAPYHLSASTTNLPPWGEGKDLQRLWRSQTDLAVTAEPSPRIAWNTSDSGMPSPGIIEIKPDIDYFALTHREQQQHERGRAADSSSGNGSATPLRSRSLSRALSRSSTFRRSMRLFKGGPGSMTPMSPSTAAAGDGAIPPTPKLPHHEIVVQGYGNGTNKVRLAAEAQLKMTRAENTAAWVTRSDSTAAQSEASADSGLESLDSAAETVDSRSPATPKHMPAALAASSKAKSTSRAGKAPMMEAWVDVDVRPLRTRRRDVMSLMMPSLASPTPRTMPSHRRGRSASMSAAGTAAGEGCYSAAYAQLVEEERQSIFGVSPPDNNASSAPEPPPRSSSRRAAPAMSPTTSLFDDLRRWSQYGVSSSSHSPALGGGMAARAATPPVVIRDSDDAEEWAAMQAFMDGDGEGRDGVEMVDDDVKPAWEQYADLGGLTEMR